tara:strand:- start:94 stop:285 length:192 start_codon:yes stop_codon:yes gene_type:complete
MSLGHPKLVASTIPGTSLNLLVSKSNASRIGSDACDLADFDTGATVLVGTSVAGFDGSDVDVG